MANKLIIFALAALLCSFHLAQSIPPNFNGQVIIESKTVNPGQSFTIKIWLVNNDLNLTSLRIPLVFDSPYLTCNYVDFSGSLIDPGMDGYCAINGQELEIAYIPSIVDPLPVISSDSGLIATLYFTIVGEAPEGSIVIDSICAFEEIHEMGESFSLWNRIEAADESGALAYIPEFYAGNIEVRFPTDVNDGDSHRVPSRFALVKNYPNPFNPMTTISFNLPEKARIRLEIFNLLGQLINCPAAGEFPAGNHEFTWDASGYPSGIYFYRLTIDREAITRKMLLLK